MQLLLTRALLLSLLLASAAHGQVVVGENVWFGHNSVGDPSISASKCLSPSDSRCLFNRPVRTFRYESGMLNGLESTLDEGMSIYLVNEGDAFNRPAIAAGEFPSIGYVLSFDPPVDVGTDFYLGINTGLGFNPLGRNVYGWVHLRDVDGTLEMLGNAMAYGGSGIVIGTTHQIVSEPSTLLLCVCLLWPQRVRYWRFVRTTTARIGNVRIGHMPRGVI